MERHGLKLLRFRVGLLAVLFVLAASCIASAQEQAPSHPSKPTTPGTPPGEEYRVYEAVLKLMDTIPKEDPHVAIYEHTLSSKCEGDNPVVPKGCTFLWVKPDTDEDEERNLRSRFHGLHHSTWKNFKDNNASSVTLHDPIAAPWKHRLTGPYEQAPGAQAAPAEVSDEWASPDMTIYLSRVGFDKKKTEALVYVLAFSYVGRPATTGDYLRFRLGPDKQWSLAGRVSYLKQDNTLTASLRRSTAKHALGTAGLLTAAGLQ